MPQFDFANVFVPQVAWLGLVFAVLYFFVVRATLPKLDRVMGDRENQVNGDLTGAQAAKAEADRVQSDYEAGLAKAQDEARARMAAGNAQAARAIEARLAETNAALSARLQAADAALGEARAKAVAEIEAVAGEAAAEIVEKLTGARPAAGAVAAATRAALG